MQIRWTRDLSGSRLHCLHFDLLLPENSFKIFIQGCRVEYALQGLSPGGRSGVPRPPLVLKVRDSAGLFHPDIT